MSTTLVTFADYQTRYQQTLDASEQLDVKSALEDLSDDARTYGSHLWSTPERAPQAIKNMIMKAAFRYSKNLDGFVSSRAGDEAVAWSDQGEDAGTAYFTTKEIEAIRQMSGTTGLYSVGMFAWGTKCDPRIEGLVPCEGTNEPIHMFSSDTEPW